MTEWQPIETAPKDGTAILVTCGELFAVVEWDEHAASYPSNEGVGWRDAGDIGWAGTQGHMPTHWMPLPQPPEQGQ